MRVIAGIAKGRKLKMVPGDSTRPIMDRVKEALFSILGRSVVGANFLDLFAGTGSVGIEALSRGAKHVTFVELDRMAVRTIQENLAITKLGDHATIRKTDVFALLRGQPDRPYALIYIAPPQYKELWLHTLQALDANPAWLLPEAVVIVQIDPSEHQPVTLKHLVEYNQRQYGNTMLWFFEVVEEAAS
jgi:16S rRNA (guanine(966)-N(2))-methyltransferase RsmD